MEILTQYVVVIVIGICLAVGYIIKNSLDTDKYEGMTLVGIDHSKTAIAYAEILYEKSFVSQAF